VLIIIERGPPDFQMSDLREVTIGVPGGSKAAHPDKVQG